MKPTRHAIRALGGAALALLLIVMARWLPDWAPTSDFAVIDLAVYRVLHGWQAVGAYSRFGWSHPGPLYFQLLAPLYALSGYRHTGIVLTVAVMNTASLVAIAFFLWRRSEAMLLSAAVWFTVYLVRLDGLLASVWNPHAPLLPFALLLVSAAAAAAGSYRLLPLVAGLASFVIQAHAGFLAVTTAVVLCAVAIIGVDVLADRRRGVPIDPSLRRAAVAAIGVACLLWSAPIFDEVRPHGQHNLQHIAAFVARTSPYNPRQSARAFERFVVAPLTPDLQLWGEPAAAAREPAVRLASQCLAVSLAGATIVFFWRRQRFERALALVLIAGGAAGLIAVRRMFEAPIAHTVLFATVLGVVAWMLVSSVPLAALVSWWKRRVGGIALNPAWLTAVLIVAIAADCARQIAHLRVDDARASAQTYGLTDLIRARMSQTGASAPLIIMPQAFWGTVTGICLQLRLAGFTPHVERDWLTMFGDDFSPTGDEKFVVAFSLRDEYAEDIQYRSNDEMLGQVDGTFVYVVHPPPASTVFPRRLQVVDSETRIADPSRVSDGRWGDDRANGGISPEAVVFPGDDDYVTVDVPQAQVIGVRLWGQPGSAWQLRCAEASGDFSRMGRVTIDDGDGTHSGEAFLKTLAGCRRLKIAPSAGLGPLWLSELQLLIGGDAR